MTHRLRRRTMIAALPTLGAIATLMWGTLMSESADAQSKQNPENTIYMDLKQGRVVIELFPDLAPHTVERIKTLARKGFYDNTPFHRVI